MKFEFEYFSYTVYLGCITICCVNNICDINADTYNIAVGKPTDQGPATYCVGTYCGISDYAVDGNFGRCSHTDNKGTIQRSWWTVDFQGYYYIASIRIIRRSNVNDTWILHRMAGLSINGKTMEAGKQDIFRDGSPSISVGKRNISIAVPALLAETRFSGINISIPGPYLTLCQVQVYLALTCTRPEYEGRNCIIKNVTAVFIYKDMLACQCSEGFELLDGSLNRYCLASGQWSGKEPNCTAARSCGKKLPTVSNSNRLSLNSSSNCYYHGCVYIFSCKRGYSQSGATPITTACDSKGIWTTPGDNCLENSHPHVTQTSGLSALTGGIIGAGTVLLIGIFAAVIVVLLCRKRLKPHTDNLYETRLNPDAPRLYSALDETVRTTTEFGEPGQIDNAIVNEEYDSCEEIRQTNQEYTNLQAVACFFQTSDLRRNNVHEPNAQKY